MHRLIYLAFTLPLAAHAADVELTHQGRLTDSIGQPLNGDQTVRLRLLDHPSANPPTAEELDR